MLHNKFNSLQKFKIGRKTAQLYSLPALGKTLGVDIQRLPVSIRVVLESVLRNCDDKKITEDEKFAFEKNLQTNIIPIIVK